jgi:hypothetical protein
MKWSLYVLQLREDQMNLVRPNSNETWRKLYL